MKRIVDVTAQVLGILGVGPRVPRGVSHQPAGVELMRTVHSTDWVREKLKPWFSAKRKMVGFVIPEGFKSYARIFPPAHN